MMKHTRNNDNYQTQYYIFNYIFHIMKSFQVNLFINI